MYVCLDIFSDKTYCNHNWDTVLLNHTIFPSNLHNTDNRRIYSPSQRANMFQLKVSFFSVKVLFSDLKPALTNHTHFIHGVNWYKNRIKHRCRQYSINCLSLLTVMLTFGTPTNPVGNRESWGNTGIFELILLDTNYFPMDWINNELFSSK